MLLQEAATLDLTHQNHQQKHVMSPAKTPAGNKSCGLY
jgi:hypothetical protein